MDRFPTFMGSRGPGPRGFGSRWPQLPSLPSVPAIRGNQVGFAYHGSQYRQHVQAPTTPHQPQHPTPQHQTLHTPRNAVPPSDGYYYQREEQNVYQTFHQQDYNDYGNSAQNQYHGYQGNPAAQQQVDMPSANVDQSFQYHPTPQPAIMAPPSVTQRPPAPAAHQRPHPRASATATPMVSFSGPDQYQGQAAPSGTYDVYQGAYGDNFVDDEEPPPPYQENPPYQPEQAYRGNQLGRSSRGRDRGRGRGRGRPSAAQGCTSSRR